MQRIGERWPSKRQSLATGRKLFRSQTYMQKKIRLPCILSSHVIIKERSCHVKPFSRRFLKESNLSENSPTQVESDMTVVIRCFEVVHFLDFGFTFSDSFSFKTGSTVTCLQSITNAHDSELLGCWVDSKMLWAESSLPSQIGLRAQWPFGFRLLRCNSHLNLCSFRSAGSRRIGSS